MRESVYSLEYDHEVVFTVTITFDVDDLPEWEPQFCCPASAEREEPTT